MSGKGERKKSYFGTFLDTLSKSSASDTGEHAGDAPVREIERLAPAARSPAAALDLRDAAVLTLAARGGAAPIDELLAPPFDSIGQLMEVIRDLQRFRLADIVDGVVHLSDAARSVALKLGAERPPAS
jgi:hypothetical protein